MPKVSIIVPVYNAQDAIKRCVDSILDQEFKDIELLLVNDGSKDSSPAILDEYASQDKRVHVFHRENSGVSATRNFALDRAQGDYIQFLDADDWIPSNSTKELVRTIENNDVDMVVADFYRVVGKNLSKKGSIVTNDVLTLQEYAQFMMDTPADYYYGVIWNKLYKRSIIEDYGIRMDSSLSFCEDFIFNMEYLLHCETICPLQVPVYYYVKTEGSLVSQNLNLSKMVRMKTSIYQYYDSFFRSVLDEKQYRDDRASIVKFLVMPATDDMAIPLMPGTKKVGKENIPVYFDDARESDLFSVSYHLNKAYSRYLKTIAQKYSLELRDIKVIDAIYKSSSINTVKEVADYTFLPESLIMLSLQKLRLKGYIVFTTNSRGVTIKLTKEADSLCDEIEQAQDDIFELCCQNMSQDMKEDLVKACLLIDENLKNYLL